MSERLLQFKEFFRTYEDLCNSRSSEQLAKTFSSDLHVIEAYPNNHVVTYGYDKCVQDWAEAFQGFEGHTAKWTYKEVFTAPVNETDVLTAYWILFELDGQLFDVAHYFTEVFRYENGSWKLLRSYMEHSLQRPQDLLP